MKKYIITFVKYFSPLVAFFVIETLTHGNEFAPTALIIIYILYLYMSSKNKKSEIILFATGAFLGLVIEIGLTSFSREQLWQNTSLLSVPLWLPFAWSVVGVVFYRFGKELE